MRVLVVSGSFKDVFNPIEAAEMIRAALNSEKNEVKAIPFCDGGEYTYEVLRHSFSFETVTVRDVLNPYGMPKDVEYLIDGETAHLISSCILRLYPEEDSYKNPLALSDYGYGQMIADAIGKGCKKLFLYIGGTSTASCGIGLIQALGAHVYTDDHMLLSSPCRGSDLLKIKKIEPPDNMFSNVEIHVIADGNSKFNALPGITALKVGKSFSTERDAIVAQSMAGMGNVARITEISPEKDFTGAAGGLLYGLEQVFQNIKYTLGGIFFNRLLNVEPEIEKADLVITGEGRYDNTADGKAPSVITRLAKKYGKPAILVCGQHDRQKLPVYGDGIIDCRNIEQLSREGITVILTGQEYYDRMVLPESYQECISFFRQQTPVLLKQLFEKAGL